MTTPDELERAVERLNADLWCAQNGPTAITRAPDLRALLSERVRFPDESIRVRIVAYGGWTNKGDDTMKAPKNLRIEREPYPHLRDDEGCVLARDYQDADKTDFILIAVAEKIDREKRARDALRAALTTGEATTPNAGERG